MTAGFGSSMAFLSAVLPFYIGASVLALIYPLLVLVACDSEPAIAIQAVLDAYRKTPTEEEQRCSSSSGGALASIGSLARIPVFYCAQGFTNMFLPSK